MKINKLAATSTPEAGDTVLVSVGTKSFRGTVVSWGVEGFGQYWAVVSCKDPNSGATYVENINIKHVDSFTLTKTVPKYEIVTTSTDEDGKQVKTARPLENSNNPQYMIKRGRRIATSFSKEIPEDKQIIKNRTLDVAKTLANKNAIEQSQTLVELYEQKKSLEKDEIKDYLHNKDLKEVKSSYEMPSFKKRTDTET